MKIRSLRVAAVFGFCLLLFARAAMVSAAEDAGAIERGEYIMHLGGCVSCHTGEGGQPLAGGLEMSTPFGDFYTPNITPDVETGIGGWSDEAFVAAMREGLAPDGSHYYPAFPYTSYARMTREDLIDLKRYLDSREPVRQINRDHDLGFPFNIRALMSIWKWLFFEPRPIARVEGKGHTWNRGNYIVNGPGHCVECHTPRNLFGALDHEWHLEGNSDGPEGESVPGLHRGNDSPFREWSADDVLFFLQAGMLPDGDFAGGSMGKVIDNSTSLLTEADLLAIAEYLTGESVASLAESQGEQ